MSDYENEFFNKVIKHRNEQIRVRHTIEVTPPALNGASLIVGPDSTSQEINEACYACVDEFRRYPVNTQLLERIKFALRNLLYWVDWNERELSVAFDDETQSLSVSVYPPLGDAL